MKVVSEKYRLLPRQDSCQELNLYAEPTTPNESSKGATNEQCFGKEERFCSFSGRSKEAKCKFVMISSKTCSPRCCKLSKMRDFPLPVVPLICRNEYSSYLLKCEVFLKENFTTYSHQYELKLVNSVAQL